MGTIDAVTREWLFAGSDTWFGDVLEDGYAVLDPLLDQLDR